MKKFWKSYCENNVWFHVLSTICVLLLFISLLLPPLGIIDGSVLTAVAEVTGIMALLTVVKAIDKGVDAKMTKGDASIEIINEEH